MGLPAPSRPDRAAPFTADQHPDSIPAVVEGVEGAKYQQMMAEARRDASEARRGRTSGQRTPGIMTTDSWTTDPQMLCAFPECQTVLSKGTGVWQGQRACEGHSQHGTFIPVVTESEA